MYKRKKFCLFMGFFLCLVLNVCCRHIRKHEANFHMFSYPTIIMGNLHSIFLYSTIRVDNFIVQTMLCNLIRTWEFYVVVNFFKKINRIFMILLQGFSCFVLTYMWFIFIHNMITIHESYNIKELNKIHTI